MLYYTSRHPSGEIEATYSGRFAFIHFKTRSELDAVHALRKENDMKGLWALGHDETANTAARILAHEYTHKHIFALSNSGLKLNSIRFWVRIRFLTSGSHQCVKNYYRMRTIYFMETRRYHEKLASAIDQELASHKEGVEDAFKKATQQHFKDTIGEAETLIRSKWNAQHLSPSGIWSSLHRAYGKWLQENFAVKLSCREENGEWFHGSFADKGITNDAYNVRPSENRASKIIKRIMLHTLVLPITRFENFDRLFDWYWVGQRTQFRTLQKNYKINQSTFWNEFLLPNAMFIIKWAGVVNAG